LKEKTDEYIADLDSTTQFINESCEIDKTSKVNRIDLYNAYYKWCTETNIPANCKSEFYKRVERLGYPTSKNKVREFKGLRLIGTEVNNEE